MPNFNSITLLGRLVSDPTVKTIGEKETSKAEFSLAVSEKFGDKEFTTFVDCELFGKGAEILAKYTHKGSHLLIQGSLRQDTWEKDGQKRSKLYIRAEDFQFIDKPPQQENVVEVEKEVSKPTIKAKAVTNKERPPF